MTIVAAAAMLMLGAAAALVLVRIYRGPNNLDRIIATEILLIIVIAGIAMEAVWHRTSTSLPLLMILGLVSFVGGVAVTRFMATGTNDTEDAAGAGDPVDGADAGDSGGTGAAP
ncbi:MAG: monovalent cation/H+ antiporter complex subunit F [Humibacillus sp.]|nr:monovalent cation/H+ antiporter complex subunit F [Humibacillus sp.]MDN5778096.1 monovalent cation/H+ antiporter complex subunit F [Humibacillus sp.]